jgi:hypothetical protein
MGGDLAPASGARSPIGMKLRKDQTRQAQVCPVEAGVEGRRGEDPCDARLAQIGSAGERHASGGLGETGGHKGPHSAPHHPRPYGQKRPAVMSSPNFMPMGVVPR